MFLGQSDPISSSSKKTLFPFELFSVQQMQGSSHLAQKHIAVHIKSMSERSEAKKSVKSIVFGSVH